MKSFNRNVLSTVITLLLSSGALAVCASTAMAQEDAADDASLEEVVVTARKMEESLQEVPLAITAVSSSMIEDLNIQGLDGISAITAGLTFESEFGRGSNRPVIRGQGTILGDSGVAYFIDGVYISTSIDDYDIRDVERIEVVKGPQSALYGRNTYSGAINIVTKSPGREFSGYASAMVAEDDEYEVNATVRGPMTENLSGSFTGRYYSLGGPFTNTYDGSDIGERESHSLSGVLDYELDRLNVRFRAYKGRSEDGQTPVYATATEDNNCYFDNGSLYGGRGRYYCGVVKVGPINSDWTVQAPDARLSVDTLQTSLSIDYEINDSWSFTSITGYNDRNENYDSEADYGPTQFQVSNFTPNGFPLVVDGPPPWLYGWAGSLIDFTFSSETDTQEWSQELRFAFSGERFSGLVGGYYYDGSEDGRDTRVLPPGAQAIADANFAAESARMLGVCFANPFCSFIIPLASSEILVPRNVNKQDIRNVALFGMLTYNINDAWRVTVEGRWQEEKIDQYAVIQDLGYPVSQTVSASETFDSFNPRVTVDWALTDQNMLYLLYAEGNKPGGFNGATAIEAGLPVYDEESIDSWEFGSKNVFLDGQVVANVAVYYNEVSGYQLSQLVQTETNTTTAIVNAGDADVKGAEIELTYLPAAVEGLRLTANYAYNDSKFTRGVDQNQGVLDDVADDGLVNCSTGDEFPDVSGCTSKFGSIVGKRIPRSPEHQAYFDAEYRQPFGADWEWYLGANYAYSSTKYAQVHNLAETGSTTLVGARFGVANENWLVQVFGNNLTGEDSTPNVLRYATPTGFTRNFAVSPRRDTYWGLRATYSF